MSASNAAESAPTTTNPPVEMSNTTEAVRTSVIEPSQPSTTTEVKSPEQVPVVAASSEPAKEETSGVTNDEPATTAEPTLPSSPSSTSKTEQAVRISLLLSTGNRHPFTINNKFLQRHNIQATESDPWNIKVYDMKTLIWHEWLGEWETRPTSPALIRLIFLGGLLDDKAALKDCRLSKTEPNVVHMTVKPQDLLEDDEVKGKEPKQGSTRQRRSGGCCVIL